MAARRRLEARAAVQDENEEDKNVRLSGIRKVVVAAAQEKKTYNGSFPTIGIHANISFVSGSDFAIHRDFDFDDKRTLIPGSNDNKNTATDCSNDDGNNDCLVDFQQQPW